MAWANDRVDSFKQSYWSQRSGVARPQFLGDHIDINKLLLINIYFNRDLYYVVALYTNGHDRIGRFCSYQLNRASSLWTFLYVVTIINEHAHNFWGNDVLPMFPRSYASGQRDPEQFVLTVICNTLGSQSFGFGKDCPF